MIKGIEYTPDMEKKISEYIRKNLMSQKEFMDRAKLAECTLYNFRTRGKISIQSLKKIKDHHGLDLMS